MEGLIGAWTIAAPLWIMVFILIFRGKRMTNLIDKAITKHIKGED